MNNNPLKAFAALTLTIIVGTFLFVLFLKLFIISVVIAFVLFFLFQIKQFFKPTVRFTKRQNYQETETNQQQSSQTQQKHTHRGRTFDHDEFK